MTDLPAPSPLVPGAGDLPVRSSDDVRALFPAELINTLEAPVRDALIESLTALMLEYQYRAGYAASQADVGRATATYLDGLGSDRGSERTVDEDYEAFRDRVLATPATVSLQAIRDAVNLILAPWTGIVCQVIEPKLDRWFISSGAGNWRTYYHRTPRYPTRLYPGDASLNGGAALSSNEPRGLLLFGSAVAYGRWFHIIVPDLTGITGNALFVASAGAPFFVGQGNSPVNSAFVRQIASTAEGVYQAIANTVNALAGHSVRWSLYADPNLK